jgi:hypothetical protein
MQKFDKPVYLPVIVTPAITAAFAWLDKLDTKFDDDGIYKITAPIDPDEGTAIVMEGGKGKQMPTKDWFKYIVKSLKDHDVNAKINTDGCPIKKMDKEEFAGKLLLTAKSGPKHKPEQVDTKGNALPEGHRVRSGDVVKVAIQPVVRTVKGKNFMSLYIAKVMLIEKVNSGGNVDFGVDEGSGYVAPENTNVDFGGDDGDDDDNGDF